MSNFSKQFKHKFPSGDGTIISLLQFLQYILSSPFFTIVCPICHTSFEKKMFSSYDFDCDECREKYEKIVNSIDKVNEITDKAVNVVEDTKNSIKNNF